MTRSALALGVAALVLRGSYLFSTENAVRGSDPLAAFSVENRYDPLQESARVSTARVGAHQQASDASPILGYADYGVELPVQAVEGDWCRVGLPMGGARIFAWLPRFALTMTDGASASLPSTPAAEPDIKMSVAVDAAGKTKWLTPNRVRAAPVMAPAESVRSLATTRAADVESALSGLTRLPSDPSTNLTWFWAVARDRAPVALEAANPVISVIYNDVDGLDPTAFSPVLVRLTPMTAPWRVVSMARGRLDAPRREEADWRIGELLQQDVVPAKVDLGAIGSMKIRLSSPLVAGEYAVVLRPLPHQVTAGWRVFDAATDGRAYAYAWLFTIR